MKIKSKLNNNNGFISIEFYYDLKKNNTLEQLINLFNLKELYFTLYSFNDEHSNIDEFLHSCNINSYFIFGNCHHLKDVTFKIYSVDISNLISKLKTENLDFDELYISSCNKDWESFKQSVTNLSPVFTFKKLNADNFNDFSLYYNDYKAQQVEIFYNVNKIKFVNNKQIESVLKV